MLLIFQKILERVLSQLLHRPRHRSGDLGALNYQAVDFIGFNGPLPSEGRGREFESRRVRQLNQGLRKCWDRGRWVNVPDFVASH